MKIKKKFLTRLIEINKDCVDDETENSASKPGNTLKGYCKTILKNMPNSDDDNNHQNKCSIM